MEINNKKKTAKNTNTWRLNNMLLNNQWITEEIKEEIKKYLAALDQMDLIDIYRTFHPKATEYTFFSSAYGTFSKMDHILGHKSNLSNFKKIEIISSIFSDHNTI